MLFYIVLKGIRELFFEDLDRARERYDDYEEEEQYQSSSIKVHLLDGKSTDSNRSSLRYCTNYENADC